MNTWLLTTVKHNSHRWKKENVNFTYAQNLITYSTLNRPWLFHIVITEIITLDGTAELKEEKITTDKELRE